MMKPKRVAVAGWILALGPSGVARRLEVLTAAGKAAGFDMVFFAPHGVDLPTTLADSGAEIVTLSLPARPTWRRALAERKWLPTLVRRHNLDLFHLPHGPVPPLTIPSTVTIHDLRDFTSFARPGRRILARTLWRRALRHAHTLLAVSQTTASALTRHLPEFVNALHVVPTGLPNRFFDPPKIEGFLSLPKKYVLHTGRSLRHKNLSLLLTAYGLLQKENPPPLVLTGPVDHSLKKMISQSGAGDKVILPGFVQEANLPSLYANATLAVFPSLYEGQGLGPLEAMASGTPTLVSRIPAHQEFTEPNAAFFDPHDPKGLARLLGELLKDREKQRLLAQKGRAHANQYTVEGMAKHLLPAWQAALC